MERLKKGMLRVGAAGSLLLAATAAAATTAARARRTEAEAVAASDGGAAAAPTQTSWVANWDGRLQRHFRLGPFGPWLERDSHCPVILRVLGLRALRDSKGWLVEGVFWSRWNDQGQGLHCSPSLCY